MVDQTTKKRIWSEANNLSATDDLAIWAYGAESQNYLNDFSKEMAWSAGDNGYESSTDVLNDLIHEIDETERRNSSFFSNLCSNDQKTRNYRNLLKYINNTVIRLQLNQAKLIKDLSILQKMESQIIDCHEQFSWYVEAGQARLSAIRNEFFSDNNGDEQSNEVQEWCVRFEKRLQTLELSKTIALQNIAQIRLLIKSDKRLIDQLEDCVSITIPSWRTQISIYMGIENVTESLKTQSELSVTIKRSMKKGHGLRSVDMQKAHESDIALKTAIQSLLEVANELSDESEKENALLQKITEV
ncbi:toxic anion resistance protein [Porcincola intestinalis]|uniref:toxic anion resistance protein n=1 Tax=Porcincola intestinalis TaxID=2606632 RepID=UPI002A802AC7|nr:toxic anion resistance protein [Porcincola intestinalis]MDY4204136.1 toxic anion resistance protein [Porcincola intestinalis]